MKLRKVLPITALLLIALVWGCNKDAGTSSDLMSSDLSSSNLKAGVLPVNLGQAASFAILSKAAITDVPSSAITGNVGASPIAGSAIGVPCTEVTGTIYEVDAGYTVGTCTNVTTNATLLTAAVGDMETAYTNAAGRTATSAATTNVGSGTLTDLTLAAGVYEWGTAVTIPTNLTLSGSATDVWIFKVAGTLDLAANKSIILSGSAQPQNIFWQVSGAVTLLVGSHFEGTILAQTNVAMQSGASLNGRVLAQTAVTLAANTITLTESKKECEGFLKAEKKAFDDGQKAAKQAFDVLQKADKQAWQSENPNPTSDDVKKAFEAEQKLAKQAFELDQKADKKAFEAQQKIDKEQCKTLK